MSVNSGQTSLAVANMVGSNTANILLAIGIASLIRPIKVPSTVLRVDLPVVLLASFGVYLLGVNLLLGRVDGLLLTAALATYLFLRVRLGEKGSSDTEDGLELS